MRGAATPGRAGDAPRPSAPFASFDGSGLGAFEAARPCVVPGPRRETPDPETQVVPPLALPAAPGSGFAFGAPE